MNNFTVRRHPVEFDMRMMNQHIDTYIVKSWDESEGNKMTEVKLQLRYKF